MFHRVCSVCIVRRWVLGALQSYGCYWDSAASYVQIKNEEVRTDIALLVTSERGGVRKCSVTDLLAVSADSYSLAVDGETRFFRRGFCFRKRLCVASESGWLNLYTI